MNEKKSGKGSVRPVLTGRKPRLTACLLGLHCQRPSPKQSRKGLAHRRHALVTPFCMKRALVNGDMGANTDPRKGPSTLAQPQIPHVSRSKEWSPVSNFCRSKEKDQAQEARRLRAIAFKCLYPLEAGHCCLGVKNLTWQKASSK